MKNPKVIKYMTDGPLYPIEVHVISTDAMIKLVSKDIRLPKKAVVNGFYNPKENIITIVNDMSRARTLHVLLHELSHAVIDQIQGVSGSERQVEMMAVFLRRFANLHDAEEILY